MKLYTENELKAEIELITHEIITKVGHGDFHVCYQWRGKYWLVLLNLAVNKNDEDYNHRFLEFTKILHSKYYKKTNAGILSYVYKKGVNMKVTNDVKIISDGMWYEVYVNGVQMKNIIKINVNLDDQPHRVTLEMYAEATIESKAILEENNILYINNKKYKLQEV